MVKRQDLLGWVWGAPRKSTETHPTHPNPPAAARLFCGVLLPVWAVTHAACTSCHNPETVLPRPEKAAGDGGGTEKGTKRHRDKTRKRTKSKGELEHREGEKDREVEKTVRKINRLGNRQRQTRDKWTHDRSL